MKLTEKQIEARLAMWNEAVAGIEGYFPDEKDPNYEVEISQKEFVVRAIDKMADRWLKRVRRTGGRSGN